MSSHMDPETRHRFEVAFANFPWLQREMFTRLVGVPTRQITWLPGTKERTVERQMASAIYKLSKQMEGHTLSWWERWL